MTVKKSELSRILLDLDMSKELFQSAQNIKMVERLQQDFDLIKKICEALDG